MDRTFMKQFFQSRFFNGDVGEISGEEMTAKSECRKQWELLEKSIPEEMRDQIFRLEDLVMDVEFELSQRMYLLGAEDREHMLR